MIETLDVLFNEDTGNHIKILRYTDDLSLLKKKTEDFCVVFSLHPYLLRYTSYPDSLSSNIEFKHLLDSLNFEQIYSEKIFYKIRENSFIQFSMKEEFGDFFGYITSHEMQIKDFLSEKFPKSSFDLSKTKLYQMEILKWYQSIINSAGQYEIKIFNKNNIELVSYKFPITPSKKPSFKEVYYTAENWINEYKQKI
jgi:hypothetical protein